MVFDKNKLKSMFMQQSYIDAKNAYLSAKDSCQFKNWDYVVLTVASEEHVYIFEKELENRRKEDFLPANTKFLVVSDTDNISYGSGASILNALNATQEESFVDKRILIINAGGHSSHLPIYTVNGRIFANMPDCDEDGNQYTLFDEILFAASLIPARIESGMMVAQGDAFVLFNALQIDNLTEGASILSVKEDVDAAIKKGIVVSDYEKRVRSILYGADKTELKARGLVNEFGKIDVFSGIVLFSGEFTDKLYSLQALFDEYAAKHAGEIIHFDFMEDIVYAMYPEANLKSYISGDSKNKKTSLIKKFLNNTFENKLAKSDIDVLLASEIKSGYTYVDPRISGIMVDDDIVNADSDTLIDMLKSDQSQPFDIGDELKRNIELLENVAEKPENATQVENNNDLIQQLNSQSNGGLINTEDDKNLNDEVLKPVEELRKTIWETLHGYSMRNIGISPAQSVHVGTTREYYGFITDKNNEYTEMGWKKVINSNYVGEAEHNTVINTLVEGNPRIGNNIYIENSIIHEKATIENGCIISGVELEDVVIPAGLCIHGIKMKNSKYVIRAHAIMDDVDAYGVSMKYFGHNFQEVLRFYGIDEERLWLSKKIYQGNVGENEMASRFYDEYEKHRLSDADIYPVCESMSEAVRMTMLLYRIFTLKADEDEVYEWLAASRTSIRKSTPHADFDYICEWRDLINQHVKIYNFLEIINKRGNLKEALECLGKKDCEKKFNILKKIAEKKDSCFDKMRIYKAISMYINMTDRQFDEMTSENYELMAYKTISDAVYDNAKKNLIQEPYVYIVKNEVRIDLPLRVNWAGGWTDTPPYCLENGGVVLNAAISLNGTLPVQVVVRKTDKKGFEFESKDVGAYAFIDDIEELIHCSDQYDQFAIHKAALIACGIVSPELMEPVESIIRQLGGGLYISTRVVDVPKGSGLGTSSILAAGVLIAISEIIGINLSDSKLYDMVFHMEQLMNSGGGWQDQVGGIVQGIKFITTKPGINQHIKVESINISSKVKEELNSRFVLVYTGQKRLASSILHDIISNYIVGDESTIDALKSIERITALMKFELERGDVDEFAKLMNKHWELSVKLDADTTNTCIEQIFKVCDDLIDAKFICGAGGGGFLQMILKKGVTKNQLHERLYDIFQDTGVDVWDCEIL